jgi:protein-tyrosine-phosphatase
MPSVLFVCTANRFRSVMAEKLWIDLLEKKSAGLPLAWQVGSAGVWAAVGEPALTAARFALERRGLPVNGHRSRPVTRALLERFQLILVMEAAQKAALHKDFPQYAGRIFLLSEMVNAQKDVADPPHEYLAACWNTMLQIEKYLVDGMDEIVRLSGGYAPSGGQSIIDETI